MAAAFINISNLSVLGLRATCQFTVSSRSEFFGRRLATEVVCRKRMAQQSGSPARSPRRGPPHGDKGSLRGQKAWPVLFRDRHWRTQHVQCKLFLSSEQSPEIRQGRQEAWYELDFREYPGNWLLAESGAGAGASRTVTQGQHCHLVSDLFGACMAGPEAAFQM